MALAVAICHESPLDLLGRSACLRTITTATNLGLIKMTEPADLLFWAKLRELKTEIVGKWLTDDKANKTMKITYTQRTPYGLAVVKATEILGKRLGYLTTGPGQDSWALRDFIGGFMLRCGDSPNSLPEIEVLVEGQDFPVPHLSVQAKDFAKWRQHLAAHSKKVFGAEYDDSAPPSNRWGVWRRLS